MFEIVLKCLMINIIPSYIYELWNIVATIKKTTNINKMDKKIKILIINWFNLLIYELGFTH